MSLMCIHVHIGERKAFGLLSGPAAFLNFSVFVTSTFLAYGYFHTIVFARDLGILYKCFLVSGSQY